MAQITVDERSVQWRAAVGRVRQAVGVTFYADIAELLYNDSHPDRFADLSNKVWTKHVRYVTEELTRSERNLSDAKMACTRSQSLQSAATKPKLATSS